MFSHKIEFYMGDYAFPVPGKDFFGVMTRSDEGRLRVEFLATPHRDYDAWETSEGYRYFTEEIEKCS